ncbi:MAG: 1-deoxy-D-xylulose-5-phosphate reductoisomerase, partial [Casimicrobiaceae bacterium]
VEAFLQGCIAFPDIATLCAQTMSIVATGPVASLADALDADQHARRVAGELRDHAGRQRQSA